MPKVQDLIAAPKPNAGKSASRADTRRADAADFRSTLADARKQSERPTETQPAEKPKSTKSSAARKKDQPQAAEATVESAPIESDAMELPEVEVTEEGEVVAETGEPDTAPVATATEQTAAAGVPAVAVAMPPAPVAAATDDAVETNEGATDEAPESDVAPQPIPSAAPKHNASAGSVQDAPHGAIMLPEDAAAVERPADQAAPLEPVKRAGKPTPAPAAAEKEKPAPAAPAQVVSSLDSLEQSVAALNDSPASPTAPAPTADVTASTSGVIPTVTERPAPTTTPPTAPAPLPPAPTHSFADVNHPKIVTSVRGELLPSGGTMQIRLDPPELGALQVLVHMRDGTMTASFQTSNDDATRLLSHSLGQLKQALESQGVSVDKLHVQQSPREQQAGNDDHRQQQHAREDESARHEQQRKEMIRRIWRRLANGQDPLDLVA